MSYNYASISSRILLSILKESVKSTFILDGVIIGRVGALILGSSINDFLLSFFEINNYIFFSKRFIFFFSFCFYRFVSVS